MRGAISIINDRYEAKNFAQVARCLALAENIQDAVRVADDIGASARVKALFAAFRAKSIGTTMDAAWADFADAQIIASEFLAVLRNASVFHALADTGAMVRLPPMFNGTMITVGANFTDSFTLVDANVAAGATLTLNTASINAIVNVVFDGSAELDGKFSFHDTIGNDTLKGGAGDDTFNMDQDSFHAGGNDTLSGGGNDEFDFGEFFTPADHIDGGDGTDKVTIQKEQFAGAFNYVFTATTMVNVEELDVFSINSGDTFTTNDATVAAGATLIVNFNALTTLGVVWNGGAETNGSFNILCGGGTGNDALTGGAQDDTINGGNFNDIIDGSKGGNDTLYGGAGGAANSDTFNMGGALTAAEDRRRQPVGHRQPGRRLFGGRDVQRDDDDQRTATGFPAYALAILFLGGIRGRSTQSP